MHQILTLCKQNPLTLIENHIMCVFFFSSNFVLRIIYGSAWRLGQRQNLLKSALCNITDCADLWWQLRMLKVSGWIFIYTQQCLFLFRAFSRRNEYKRHLLQCCVLFWGSACKYQFPANMNEINVAGIECDRSVFAVSSLIENLIYE